MSDKLSLIVGSKGDAGPSVDKAPLPLPLNARMQWMADLVCAILSAESDRKATVLGAMDASSRHVAGTK